MERGSGVTMHILGIILLVIAGFFAVITLIAPRAAGDQYRGATTLVGGFMLAAILGGIGLLLILL